MPQLIGVVLAGGRGSRFGKTKGDLILEGTTLADRAASALRPLCGSTLISISAGGQNPAPGFRTVEDSPPPGRGPLAGLLAAYDSTGKADLLVLACDYPRVSTRLLQEVVSAIGEEDDLVIVTDRQGRDHPLVGFWRRSAERHVRAAMEERTYKVRALLAEVNVRRVGPVELAGFDLDETLLNVNTIEDLEALGYDSRSSTSLRAFQKRSTDEI